MPNLISHRLPPPLPCAPKKRRSQICLVYCRVSPKTRDLRSPIPREKTGHTPARKKHGDMTRRASSVRARVAIQEALSAEMSTLQVNDSLSGRIVESSDHCQMMIITPDRDDDDDQCVDDSADDEDYDHVPIANPPPLIKRGNGDRTSRHVSTIPSPRMSDPYFHPPALHPS